MTRAAGTGVVTASTLVLLSTLYFAQGLPYGFFTQAMPVVLRQAGYSLTQVGAIGLLFAPWGLKFLWAPYVDRYGTRRQWLVSLQLASTAVALLMATLDLSGTMRWLLVGIAVMNLLSATQDIATDGLAVTLLGPAERGLGNGVQVGAYRVGMIVGGSALLWLLASAGWRVLFVAMAVLLALTVIPVWLFAGRDDTVAARAHRSEKPGAGMLTAWLARIRRPGVLTLILFIAAYKFGDSMVSTLAGPYMSDAGLSLAQIGLVKGALSSIGALAGAAAGGFLAYRFGRRNALLVGGLTQTVSIALYIVSSLGAGGFALIVAASLAEHILGGAATVALFTLMMDAAEKGHEGSDYTLLACAVVGIQGISGIVGGILGDLFGYSTVFSVGLLLSGLGCVVLIVGIDRGGGPDGVRSAWGRTPRPRIESIDPARD